MASPSSELVDLGRTGGTGIGERDDLRRLALRLRLRIEGIEIFPPRACDRAAVAADRLGLGYGYGGLKRLVNVVGPAYAKEIMFTARRFDAARALAMGLVNCVVPVGELEATVRQYAADIAANAPLTIKTAKAAIDAVLKDPADRNLAKIEAMTKACFDSADYAEGRKAFMEKRKPVFTGR